jgi:hypothetical protein
MLIAGNIFGSLRIPGPPENDITPWKSTYSVVAFCEFSG